MENLKSKQLNFKKVMFSMAVIMLVWAMVWYPFEYFVFPRDLSTTINNLIEISREYLRMLPAVLFFIYYKNSIKTNFKEMFSLKFNYKWFFIVLLFCIADLCAVSYFTNGKIYFNPQKMMLYDVIVWLSLGLCQEFVFRGWSYNAFKEVTSQRNAVIIQSAFFSASHWFAHFFMFFDNRFNLADFISVTIFTFVFGVAMCIFMIKTKNKSIVPLIIFHAVWDFIATAMH